MRVIGVGDNVVDQYEHTGTMYPGGNALNFAVYAHMLGAESAYMGIYGDDRAGDIVSGVVGEFGIDQSRCRRLHGENGCARVTLRNGDRVFLGSNKGGISRERPLLFTQDDLRYLAGFRLIHTSVNSHIEGELQKLHALDNLLSFDFSECDDDDYFRKTMPYVDVAILSCGSVTPEATDRRVRRALVFGAGAVIATRGAEGSLYCDGEIAARYVPVHVAAQDTLGAGDAFLTAFLLCYIQAANGLGKHLSVAAREALAEQAMAEGSRFAARVCMLDGAFGHGAPIVDP